MPSVKAAIPKREASGLPDYIALGLTTFGVGYIPGAPGTYGSAVGLGAYLAIERYVGTLRSADCSGYLCHPAELQVYVAVAAGLIAFTFIGIWASGRSEAIFGNGDPSQAVVDEVLGQLVTFCFIPFGLGWKYVLAGFVLFRLFDILKPFPANKLQDLPGGLGICADDIIAGVYAGICLAVGYAITLAL